MEIETLHDEIKKAKEFFEYEQYTQTIENLARAIEVCPWSIELRQMRATALERHGDIFKAIQDLRFASFLVLF